MSLPNPTCCSSQGACHPPAYCPWGHLLRFFSKGLSWSPSPMETKTGLRSRRRASQDAIRTTRRRTARVEAEMAKENHADLSLPIRSFPSVTPHLRSKNFWLRRGGRRLWFGKSRWVVASTLSDEWRPTFTIRQISRRVKGENLAGRQAASGRKLENEEPSCVSQVEEL
jgi:hypothetical protein